MKNFFLLLFFTLSLPSLWGQSPCTGNVAIENLANGMDYTITVGAGGVVDITVTVVDNPAGLVGFLGGSGNPISFPDASGTFTYNLTGQADPYVLDMFFNWAAGGAGNSETVSCAAAAGPEMCMGNVAIENLANGMDYTITVAADGTTVDVSVTVVDNPAGLVGFLGGSGNPISFPDATGTFTYNLTGQPSPYVLDMFFNWAAGGAGNSETVSCPNGGGPAVLEIPIDFDDASINYDLVPFGSNISAMLDEDPTDPANTVLSITKTVGGDCWAGVTVGESCLANPIPFAPGNMTFYMDVYSPVAGAPFLLKVEECGNPGNFSEVLAQTTIANGWETLVFDFANGCANPPNPASTYSKVIVFPQFTCDPGPCGVPGVVAPFTTEPYYVDNISMTPPPAGPPALPITFDDPFTNYELAPFGQNITATIGPDPTDPANEVLCVIKDPAPDCWAGVTVGGPAPTCLDAPIDFSQGSVINVDVYSPTVGAPMLLKVEDCSNGAISSEVLVLTTVANTWETLTFDFGTAGCPGAPVQTNTYDKISIFPQFTCTPDACGAPNPGTAPTTPLPYYFDNIEFIIDPPPPPLPSPDFTITFDDPGVDYNLDDFGDIISTFGLNPLDPTDTVACVTKPPGAQCWAGTTVGGPAGCLENPVPFTADDQILTVDVYSPNVGTPFLLKVEDCTNGAIASEVLVLTTVANEWETLVFDFSAGCPAINLANTYDRVSVFSEFSCPSSACGALPPGANTPGDGTTVYYFDNIAFGLPYNVDIADPCVCLDNASVIDLDAGTGGDDGTFGEVVSITGPGGGPLPAGLVFEVTAITGGAGGTIAVGDLLIFNAATGHYEINFEHVDAVGYTITVDQIAPGIPTPALTISNVCAYPNPVFDPVPADQYCAVDAAETLGGDEALPADVVSFTIDGAPATEIDPGALAVGTHLVVMTWDGSVGTNDGSGTVANPNTPGCIQTVQKSIEIINDAPAITCPPTVVLDCTETLPDGVTTVADFVAAGGTVNANCTVTSVAFNDVVTITNCGIEIVRTYTIGSGTAESSCVQMLRTEDTTAPVIVCPPNQVLSCFETVPTGLMTAADFIAAGGTISDDCTADLSDFTVFSQNDDNGGDNCPGNGQAVVRTYFVQDLCGNTTTCEQTFTYLESTQGPVITSILPTCFKYCASLANPMEEDVTYETDCSFGATVNITGPTQIGQENCPGTIYRYTYTVTDDCGRTSAPVTRDFVIGNDGPTIECAPFNLLLECGDPNNSDYIAAHVASVTANSSCELGVNITYFPTNFNNITCNTSTVVTFRATDDCGRQTTCTTTINISDNTAPEITSTYVDGVCNEAVCGSNVNFWFNEWKAKVLEGLSATDACDSNVSFTTTGSPNVPAQDCPDGTAETVVTWIANDNCGNTSGISYSFYVVPADEPAPAPAISGLIATEMSETVESVTVTLDGNNTVATMQTAADGIYEFSDLTEGQNYSVTPYLDENPLNGVSSFDLVLIAKHILQIETLDSPYKMIAADINASGSITTMDMVELRKLILHVDEDFANNTSWRFVETAYLFPDPTNPFATIFPEEVFINGLTADEIHDFVGVKVGDVNGSAVANALADAEARTATDDLVFEIENQKITAGEVVDVTFHSDNFNAIHGYQFSLGFDQAALEFNAVQAGTLTNMTEANFGLTLLDNGVITTSWTNNKAQSAMRDADLFTISFIAKADGQLRDLLNVNSSFTKAEAYDGNLGLMNVQMRFDEASVVTNELHLYQNMPNPFKQETLIGFELPEAGTATLTIYNGSGTLLKQIDGEYAKGYNSISLSEDGLSPGLLYYQLATEAGIKTRKMLFSGK